jgi:hypothetical protein
MHDGGMEFFWFKILIGEEVERPPNIKPFTAKAFLQHVRPMVGERCGGTYIELLFVKKSESFRTTLGMRFQQTSPTNNHHVIPSKKKLKLLT